MAHNRIGLSAIQAAGPGGGSEASVGSCLPSFQLPAGASTRGVLITNTHHLVTFTDPNIFDLLAVSPGDLLGRDFGEVVRTVLKHRFEDPDAFEASCRWLRDHPEETSEDVLQVVGSEPRVLHRYSTPLFDAESNCLGRAEIYSDITMRRELEASVRRAYAELHAAQEQLVRSEKLRAIGEISSGVAHDFNNTLGIILGNIQLLLRTTQDERARTKLKAAERAALDGIDTVRRIQEFAKTQPREPGTVLDLGALAAEVVEMMRPAWEDAAQAQGRKIEVRLEPTAGAFVVGSAPEIREVLANIFLNAIQAMPSGGTIDISTGCSKTSSWVKIADTGVGMAEDVRRRIFDPFFSTRGVEGTGLGMSVAYGIVRRHGGSISVESEPGRGTVVTVLLPAAREMVVESEPHPQAELRAPQPAKILVVDDEEMFAEVLFQALSESGHAVCVARSGADAIEQFKEGQFDLVFTDLGMPEMSGWQVARRIKDIEPRTPVVLLTGWGAALDEAELDQRQVDMVLSKPVKLETLSSVVAEALGWRRD